VDVEVDFDSAVFEVEEWRVGIGVVGRSGGGDLGLKEGCEGLGEGWLIVVVGRVGRVGSVGRNGESRGVWGCVVEVARG
jgi:hypothetical protein